MSFYYLLMYILFSEISVGKAFLASNKQIMTGNISFVCAFFREKDYAIDDISMPEILTFCSCVVIHNQWILTARLCYVQTDWFVAPIEAPFTNVLPKNRHIIKNIFDEEQLTLVQVSPQMLSDYINVAPKPLRETKICELYGFSPPGNKPVSGKPNLMIYKVWHMEGDLLKTQVQALHFRECQRRFKRRLSEYKQNITTSTLCLNPLKNEYLEPCSFDRGAPIICDGLLQGILVYERPLIEGFPLHLPTGCYGYFRRTLSIYAESLTVNYVNWIYNIISSYS